MKKKHLRILTIVGTRPEIIRLSRVISLLDKYCEHFFIHTGQNYDYELNQVFFEDLELRKPDFYLNCAATTDSPSETIGQIIIESDKKLRELQPDALLVLGDTNSCLAVIPAKRLKIPIFHMEAGNRCFDLRVPEEINRKIVDHTSDVNITYSSIAKEYLLKEGCPRDLTIKVGSPMKEVIKFYFPKIKKSNILSRLNLTKNNFFLFSVHREENIDSEENFKKFISILNKLAENYNLPIIVTTHPRTRIAIDNKEITLNKNINLIKPIGFCDYINLQINSKCVLSDSGTISEESSILNFPALNLREAHERPEAMEETAVMMVGMNLERINQCLSILENQHYNEKRFIKVVNDYEADNISEKIVRIIHSYTDYVNRVIWKKRI